MPIRPIVMVGDPVLHTPTKPIDEITDEIRALIDDMWETNDAANGAGLAANQIGVSLRVFVYDCPDDEGVRHRGLIINPVLETSPIPEGMPDPEDDWEGCLSVPGEAFPTGRAAEATVTGVDLDGNPVTVSGTGFFARCLQHETDHLDGYLYLDRLVGRNKRESKRSIRDRGWADKGILSWDPAVQSAEDV